MTTIQGNNVPLELSFDNELTWQVLVCLVNYAIPTTLPTTKTDTFCGQAVGIGNQTFGFTGTAVDERFPTGGSQVTYNNLLTAQTNKTLIKARAKNPNSGSIGEDFFIKGDVYVTNLNLKMTATNVIDFDFTLEGTGIPDIQYP